MVCVNKSLESMLSEIGNPRKAISDEVIPARYYTKSPGNFLERHEFFWLWQYGRELSDSLQKLHLPIELRFDINTQTPVQSAIENAYDYAAGSDRGLKYFVPKYKKRQIKVEVYVGDNGIVFTITDSGKGFDFNNVVKRNRNKKKEDLPHGFDIYDAQFDSNGRTHEVSGEGNRISIMYKF